MTVAEKHTQIVAELVVIAVAADELEDFIGKNAGHNADFPMALKFDNDETAEHVARLFTNLNKALRPYRIENGKPT